LSTHLSATSPLTEIDAPHEGRGAFGGFIGPRTLLGLVANTVPWLFERVDTAPPVAHPSEVPSGPHQWRDVLRVAHLLEASPEPTAAQRTDYFALCLAAHFASAATYVPTDVDTKIRRALWQQAVGTDELERMRTLALGLREWDMREVSARIVHVESGGAVSGHDGERLSVSCGGLIASLLADDRTGAEELETAIDDELAREARAFDTVARSRGRELDLLRLAALLTHNAGDVMQGLALAGDRAVGRAARQRYGDLARERFDRYGGAFGKAAALYRSLLSAEGHRNYPLRKPRALRRHPSLLLPIAPFLDDWGANLAVSEHLGDSDRAEVFAALVEGCRKVPGQVGYYRALAGFARAYPRGIDAPLLVADQTTSVKRTLRDATLRQKIAVRRESFETSIVKRARAVLSDAAA
jgi:hypothetical protein